MDKNTIIAIFLSTLVIIGGFTLQSILFPPQEIRTQDQQTEQILSNDKQVQSSSENNKEHSNVFIITEEDSLLKEEKFVIETKLIKVEFTNKGGDILSYKLKNHSEKDGFVEMAQYTSDANRAFSVILGNENTSAINDIFNVKIINDTTIGFYKTFTINTSNGDVSYFTLAKQYKFLPDDYMFELKVTIDGDSSFEGLNNNGVAYTIKTSPQIGPSWDQKQDRYEYRKFYHLIDGKKKAIMLKAGENKKITDPISWTGVAGKYFTLIALPNNQITNLVYSMYSANQDEPVSQLYISRAPISTKTQTDTWHFYVGPRTEKYLSKYNVITNNPYELSNVKLDSIVESSGFLGPLEFVLKQIMVLFYKIIPNWGISIIILTILMRLIIFPLTKKSSESTLKMQELQPKIKEIQDKYKNNQQKMNEEMAKFYQTAGYNPLSGCLPMLIQFPLIFAMYNLFNNYFEFRGAMFIPGWIPDLSQGDSVLTLASAIPLLGWTDIRLLPIIYVISQLLFGKVTQTPGATQQNSSMKFMMYGMPLMFFFVFYNAPSGLLVYWICSNLLTLVQQVIINKMMQAKKEEQNNKNLKLVKK